MSSRTDNEQFIKVVKYCLIMSGLWNKPIHRNKLILKFYKIYCIVVPLLFYIIYVLILVELIRMIVMQNNVDYVITTIGLTVTETRILVRLVIFSRNKILNLLEDVTKEESKIWQIDDQEIKLTYVKYIKVCRKYCLCQLVTSGIAVTTFGITGVIGNNKLIDYNRTHNASLEIHYWYPFYFPGKKLDHLVMTYSVDTFFALWGVTLHSTTHVILTTLFSYAASQLHILRIQIREISFKNCNEENQIQILKELVQKHLHLIKFVKILNSKTRSVLLIEFVLCSVDISSASVNLAAETTIQTIFFSEYFIMLFVQVLIMSWTANEVKIQGELVSEEIFGTDWYYLNPKTRNYILFIIIRTQKPLAFNIGPFSIMTTETGLSILRAAYSYLSIMKK